TGTVTFTFYTSGDCSTGATGAGTVALDSSGVADPSSVEGPLAAGSYSFKATYNGDGNYNSSTSACEPLTVNKHDSSTATEIHDAAHNVVTSVSSGSTVHDKATVTGIAAFTPTGSVTFTFYTAASNCSGASVSAGTVTLDSNGVAHPSSSEGPLQPGSYSFQATYSGDSNYNVSTSACEPLTVTGNNSQITPTGTTCQQFAGIGGQSAQTLSSLSYSVKNGAVNQVSPGVFFYWVKVTATAGTNTFNIVQTITSSNNNFNHFFNIASGSAVYNSTCNVVSRNITQTFSAAPPPSSTTSATFTGVAGQTFYIGIKYDSTSVKGFTAPSPNTQVDYSFSTTGVPASTSGISLIKPSD